MEYDYPNNPLDIEDDGDSNPSFLSPNLKLAPEATLYPDGSIKNLKCVFNRVKMGKFKGLVDTRALRCWKCKSSSDLRQALGNPCHVCQTLPYVRSPLHKSRGRNDGPGFDNGDDQLPARGTLGRSLLNLMQELLKEIHENRNNGSYWLTHNHLMRNP